MATAEPASFKIDPNFQLVVLSRQLTGFLSDAKVTLRSLDDGSFNAKASAVRPGTLLHVQIAPSDPPSLTVARVCGRALVNLVGALLTFLDRMIALKRSMGKTVLPPPAATTGAEIVAFVNETLEQEYRNVSQDRNLSAPAKVAMFSGIDPFSESAALSLIGVRNSIEHHACRPRTNLVFRYGQLKLMAGGVVLTKPGQAAPENTAIMLGMDHVAIQLPEGVEFSVSEEQLDHVLFTIQHLIAPEIVRVFNVSAAASHT